MNSENLSLPVSVIVPLYNREAFLPQLLRTLESQTFKDFEVILIDDGSNDGTRAWIEKYFRESALNYHYVYQENGGPYKARNNGLKHAKGKYIVLFDSDDEWPVYHLKQFFDAMESSKDVDWIFASIEIIEHESRNVLQESNFVDKHGNEHPVISLQSESRLVAEGQIKVITDQRLPETMIEHTLPGSMQCSIIRRSVFDIHLFDDSFRTAYDRFFCMKTAIRGFKFAYLDNTHLIYHVHDDNISTVSANTPAEKLKKSAITMIRGYRLIEKEAVNLKQKKAAKKRISEVHAWELSMAEQSLGDYQASISAICVAINNYPQNILYYKTLLATCIKLISSKIINFIREDK
ncbi:glycosyltransferase [Alteromonas genovensis]|uniref:Glycosyltransferase n=1 Tax=Alteromonas genovensis TaxID=471225 RepID=A0A6N9TAT4_9ALTE|nr:glycosyltransferase family 2 protein [Alteromonas genovensis]NDW14290.1 glycosyltransferase [Alteromonas genovensis]